jgi:hypothetical protein
MKVQNTHQFTCMFTGTTTSFFLLPGTRHKGHVRAAWKLRQGAVSAPINTYHFELPHPIPSVFPPSLSCQHLPLSSVLLLLHTRPPPPASSLPHPLGNSFAISHITLILVSHKICAMWSSTRQSLNLKL